MAFKFFFRGDYISTTITPILTYLRSSLKSSLRKPSNLKAIQKMISLKSGVKMGLMKKLSLYIFLVLMWCNAGFAEWKVISMSTDGNTKTFMDYDTIIRQGDTVFF